MTVGSVMSAGVQGMLSSQQRLNESAREIANAGKETSVAESPATAPDLAKPLVQMQADKLVFDASAKVVTAADEAVGSLIDTQA